MHASNFTYVSEDAPNCICMLVRAFDGGGAQRDAIELANGLFRAGWPMVLATLDSNGPLSALLDPALPVIDLGRGSKKRMALAGPALIGMIRRLRPAAVIASEASANVLTVLATRVVGKSHRPLLILREVTSPLEARRADPFLQNRLAYRLARWLYPLADRVLTFTEGARRDLVDHFAVSPAKAVNLGTNAVMTGTRLASLATLLPVVPGLIVSVGRLSPEKGHAGLIDAFALLTDSPSARLVIMGEGPERGALERRIAALGLAHRVRLPGYAIDPTVLLRRAALFVSASRHEGFGNAIVEALACGTQVVSTDAPHGPREILLHGRLGTLVPVGDVPALAAAIGQTLRSPQNPEMLRARAADFTTEKAVERFALLLGDLGFSRSFHRSAHKVPMP
jgi:glycosyltransferase involved in cell wall biosynthesis